MMVQEKRLTLLLLVQTISLLAVLSSAASLRGLQTLSWPDCYQNNKNCNSVDFTKISTSLYNQVFNDGSFQNTNWEGKGFGGSQCKNANFAQANLKNTAAGWARFDNANLRGADLSGARADNCHFDGADLTSAIITSTTVLRDSYVSAKTIFPDGLKWNFTSFFGSTLNGMRLVLDDQDISGLNFKAKFASCLVCSFSRMKAHKANFTGCNLTKASMWSIQAEDIDFSNADLSDVPLHYASLKRANFQNAVLSRTGLKYSNMQGCNLIGANLTTVDWDSTTNLIDCKFDSTTTKFPNGFDPLGRGMIDTKATTPNLSIWPNCYNEKKNCDGLDFTKNPGYNLWSQTYNDGSFVNTKWEGQGFGGSQAKNTNFSNANLKSTSANHIRFDNSVLRGVDFSGANLDNTHFEGADLTATIVSSATVLTNTYFNTKTIFPDGLTWNSTSFFGSDLRGMLLVFDDQDATGVNFAARFTNYAKCSFSRMKAFSASCVGCNLANSAMWVIQAEDINFSMADLSGVPLHYSNLKRANFQNAVLSGTGLKSANMQGCNLIGANLANPSPVDWDATTNVLDCKFDSTTIFPADFNPLGRGMINIEAAAVNVLVWPNCYNENQNCDGLDFTKNSGYNLWSQTYNDGSFANTKWEGLGFGGSQAKNTNFTNANLKSTSANHIRFDNAVLRGADLSGATLDNTHFEGADLTSAIVTSATILANSYFDSKTIFPDGLAWNFTSFFGTDMKGMLLVLDNEDISGVDLAARFKDYSKCSFSHMKAQGASFSGCNLANTAMWAIEAEEIDFSNADLTGVPLHYSNLKRANFANAKLYGTGLKNSNLERCWLVGADLTGVDWDSSTDLKWCKYDYTTIFPEGFDPSSRGLIDKDAPTSSPTLAPTMPGLDALAKNTMVFDDIPCFSLGINPASVNYYSNQFTFKNAFAESGGCCWPADAKVDADGNLLQPAPAGSTEYWLEGRNLMYRLSESEGHFYPEGTYILRAKGTGVINLQFDVGPSTNVVVPTDPDGFPVQIAHPSSSGVQLTIIETSETDPVREISFMLEEFDQGRLETSPFSPIFVETLAGMKVLRFMDMGLTNQNNAVHWEDRSTKTSFSQARTINRIWNIASVDLPSQTASPFIGPFAMEVTTTEAHGITTGQLVKIEGLTGQVNVARQGRTSFVRNLSEVYFPKMAEVTGPNTFLVDIGNWDWDKTTYSLSSVISATAGRVVLEIHLGVAYEYMIDLSKEIGADPWFCVPHLASDDYVRQMANLIANSGLSQDTTVHLELSNEVWNSMFSSQWYAEAMQRKLGLGASALFHGQRSKEVFEIFQEEFAKVSTAPKLNRILATQSVSTWVSRKVIEGAGGAGSFDSLAVAPYFTAWSNDVFARSTDGASVTGVTVDDVLELCLQDIFGKNRQHIIDQNEVATEFGAQLIAYEGGQHLGGGGPSPLGGRLENNSDFQALMIAANRDPRMHNLYQAYFQLWGKDSGGLFAHFSFIGTPSKYGSWGVKESYYKPDTVEDSPKWMTVKGIAEKCGNIVM